MSYKTPLEMLEHWEKTRGDEPYLNQPVKGRSLTYTWKESLDQARRIAAYLKQQNFAPGSHIALMSKNCAHWMICDIAIWMAGHVSVPLYPNLTGSTVGQILEHSESKLLFIGKLDDWKGMQSGVPADLPAVRFPKDLYNTPDGVTDWDTILNEHEPLKEIATPSLEDVATVIYTSGTTGLPKGVMHSFRALSFSGHEACKEMGFTTNDRTFSYLPLSHVAERLLIEVGSFYIGGQIFFAESLETFMKDLANAQPTIFLGVPRIWSKLQEGILKKMPQKKLNLLLSIPILSGVIKKKIRAGLGLNAAHILASGAAPLPRGVGEWFNKLGMPIIEAYAMTENFAYSHCVRPWNYQPGTVGQPFPKVDCKISAEGEIVVKSQATMLGYFKEPEKTKEVMDGDYLKTGDQGEIDSDGLLRITGRVKDLFKTSKGKYVAPAPIELKYQAHANIENICIVGSGLPQPIALILLKDASDQEGATAELTQLMHAINTKLDAHERVKKLVVLAEAWTVENEFLTPTLKVKRNVIEKKYAEHLESFLSQPQKVLWQPKV